MEECWVCHGNERQSNDIAKNNLRKVKGRVVKLRKPYGDRQEVID